jgi:anti-anti-sigma regulatory factor
MNQVQVLYLNQDLIEQNVKSVENQVLSLLAQGYSKIVLEGEHVHEIDWPAARTMVGWKRVLREFEGDIKLAGLSTVVTEPLNRYGVKELLETYPNVHEAMNSFEKYSDDANY